MNILAELIMSEGGSLQKIPRMSDGQGNPFRNEGEFSTIFFAAGGKLGCPPSLLSRVRTSDAGYARSYGVGFEEMYVHFYWIAQYCPMEIRTL